MTPSDAPADLMSTFASYPEAATEASALITDGRVRSDDPKAERTGLGRLDMDGSVILRPEDLVLDHLVVIPDEETHRAWTAVHRFHDEDTLTLTV